MLLAVYGTLRKGDANHGYLHGHRPLVTERVEGFEMFNLSGAYPYVARGADDITVEVYDISPEVLAPIERMERSAGYEMAKAKTTVGIADIFCMTEKKHAELQSMGHSTPPKILSGDWFEWLSKYRPGRLGINTIVLTDMEGDGDAISEF